MPYDLLLKNLNTSVANLKGIGPKTSKLFEKLCGERIIDLLLTTPRIYKKRLHAIKLSEIYIKKEIAIKATVVKHLPQFNPKMPYRVLCNCNDEEFELIFFRGYKKYLNNILPVGQTKIICGKLERFSNKYQIIHPETISSVEDLPFLHGLLGVYSLTRGLTMSFYRKIIIIFRKNMKKLKKNM